MLLGALLGIASGLLIAWINVRIEGWVGVVASLAAGVAIIVIGMRSGDTQALGVSVLCGLGAFLITTFVLRRSVDHAHSP